MRVSLRSLVIGTVLLGFAAGGLLAQGVRFSGPPSIGDRVLGWHWEPIPGTDPYFLGNTVLEEAGEIEGLVPGELRILRTSTGGTVLFAVGTADDRVYLLQQGGSGTWSVQSVLPAPPSRLLDLDIHRSDRIVLGGLEDGRIAVWDLTAGGPEEPEIYPAQQGPCTYVRFLINSIDPGEQRLITAGKEGGVQVWYEPGNRIRQISASPAMAIALTGNGSLLTVADTSGVIRIYEPIEGQFLERLDGHQAMVTELLFTLDQRRLFSMDETGRVLAWNAAKFGGGSAVSIFEIQVTVPNQLRMGLRQPDGALLYLLESDGTFQVFDGFDGRLYRSADVSSGETIYASTFDRYGRQLYAAREDAAIRIFRTGFCTPSVADTVCFAGYKIWRSETPHAEDATLLRVYGFGDSTWSFVGQERVFVDPDSMIARGSTFEEPLAGPHNGMPYYYSITAFERRYLNGAVFEILLNSIDEGFYRSDPSGEPMPVSPHGADRTELPLLDDVIVVPNPYEAGKVPWDAELGEHIEFRHLPDQATIRIYTVAGDLLRTIEHGRGSFEERTDARSWDLKNQKGEDVASGVYVYHISTMLNAEETTGYFIVVR